MKRIICCILCAALLLCLNACMTQEEKFELPVSFYYLRVKESDQVHHGSASSLIAPEILEGKELHDDLTTLLQKYLSGPSTEICYSPFPEGTALVEWSMDGTTLCITLSDEIAGLTGIDMTLACACLAKTCLELDVCSAVRIRAESLTLDGKVAITMNESILLLLDDAGDSAQQNGQ